MVSIGGIGMWQGEPQATVTDMETVRQHSKTRDHKTIYIRSTSRAGHVCWPRQLRIKESRLYSGFTRVVTARVNALNYRSVLVEI